MKFSKVTTITLLLLVFANLGASNQVTFDNLDPEEDDRIESESDITFEAEITSEVDADIQYFLNEEEIGPEFQINADSTETLTHTEENVRSSRYTWYARATYEQDGETQTETSEEKDFTVYSNIVVDTENEWLEGTHQSTSTDMLNNVGALQQGFIDGDTNTDSTVPYQELSGFWRYLPNEEEYADFSGNNLNPVTQNNIIPDIGILDGDAGEFDPSDSSYVEVPDSEELNPNEFTVSAWIYKTKQGESHILNKADRDEGSGYSLLIDRTGGTNRAGFYTYSDGEESRLLSADEVPEQEWVHIAGTYREEDESNLYINGERVTNFEEEDRPLEYEPNTNSLLIGTDEAESRGNFFEGQIDHPMVFHTHLTDREVGRLAFNDLDDGSDSRYDQVFDVGKPVEWDQLRVENDLMADTGLEAVFLPQGDENTGNSFELDGSGSFREFSLLEDTESALFRLNGVVNDMENTWSAVEFEIQFIEKFFNFEASDLELNNTDPVEGETVEATATVENLETGDADVPLEFKVEGKVDGSFEELALNEAVFETSGEDQTTVSLEWEAVQGPNEVTITADPDNTIEETDESNNERTETLNVPIYGNIYGQVNETITLSDEENVVFERSGTPEGVVYFADIDSDFDFSDLEPVPSAEDLEKVDEKLETSSFEDNIENTWSSDGDFVQTEDYPFYDDSVPVVESTEDSSFTTGIFYEDEDGEGIDNTDTMVFSSQIREDTDGVFEGFYNYEAKIPSQLETSDGSNEKIELYRQLK